MNACRTALFSSVFSTLCMLPYGAVAAEQPSEQMEAFFGWDDAAQRAHVGNSILMIGVVASQTAPKIAACIDDWYLDSAETKVFRQSEIIDTMRELPEYTPEAIILAVVEKNCGKFKRVDS